MLLIHSATIEQSLLVDRQANFFFIPMIVSLKYNDKQREIYLLKHATRQTDV